MAQINPTWMAVNPDPVIIKMESAMWIPVLSPHYQVIRADRVESVKVQRNHNGDCTTRYNIIAIIQDREYTVSQRATQLDAETEAKNLQIVLENS